MKMSPESSSTSLSSVEMREDLPAPVRPTIPTRSPPLMDHKKNYFQTARRRIIKSELNGSFNIFLFSDYFCWKGSFALYLPDIHGHMLEHKGQVGPIAECHVPHTNLPSLKKQEVYFAECQVPHTNLSRRKNIKIRCLLITECHVPHTNLPCLKNKKFTDSIMPRPA